MLTTGEAWYLHIFTPSWIGKGDCNILAEDLSGFVALDTL